MKQLTHIRPAHQTKPDPMWKKTAAAMMSGMTQTGDQPASEEEALEQAFADQAYQTVSQRVGVLMRDPYRLGFETIWQNEAGTKLCGMFGFRVGPNLYYCPVMFLRGSIALGDQLWDVNRKRFQCISPEIARDMVSQNRKNELGESRDRDETFSRPTSTYIDKLAFPPTIKGASTPRAHAIAEMEHVTSQDVKQLLTDLRDKQRESLHSFLKTAGSKAFEGLIAMVENFGVFAEGLHNAGHDLEALAKSAAAGDAAQQAIKSAASQAKPLGSAENPLPDGEVRVVEKFTDLVKSASVTAEEIELFHKSGRSIIDTRDKETIPTVYLHPEVDLARLNSNCEAEVLCSDLSLVPGHLFDVVDACPERDPVGSDLCSPCDSSYSSVRDKPRQRIGFWFVTDSGMQFVSSRYADERDQSVYGIWKADCGCENEVDNPKVGDFYLLISEADGGACEDVFRLLAKSDLDDGMRLLTFGKRYSSHSLYNVLLNPNASVSAIRRGIVRPSDFRMVNVSKQCEIVKNDDDYAKRRRAEMAEKTGLKESMFEDWQIKDCVPIATTNSHVTDFMLRGGRSAEVTVKRAATGRGKVICRTEKAVKELPFENEEELFTKLACDLRLSGTKAQEIAEFTRQENFRFLLQLPAVENGMFKTGSAYIRMDRAPSWIMETDPIHNVQLMRGPQVNVMDADAYAPSPMALRLKDAWDPTMGHPVRNKPVENELISREELLTLAPEDIQGLAKSRGAASVFDSAMLGSMLHSEGSVDFLDEYLPKIEDAIDGIGRIRFLMFWKPRDFEDAFGEDDMRQMEVDLKSQMTSLGRLHLNLSRRAPKRTEKAADFTRTED